MLLGRQSFFALPDLHIPSAATEEQQLSSISTTDASDAFFCDLVTLIPQKYYVPTDAEENWLRSVPHAAKKYHKNVKAIPKADNSKKTLKRMKFTPGLTQNNEEKDSSPLDRDDAALPVKKHSTAASLEALKERLHRKIQSMRETRGNEKKAKANARKDSKFNKVTTSASNKVTPQARNKTTEKGEFVRNGTIKPNGKVQHGDVPNGDVPKRDVINGNVPIWNEPKRDDAMEDVPAISYGNLLVDTDSVSVGQKRTRNGQAIRGIKHLLKKAEKKEKRMQELKKTEEGIAIAESEHWKKAIDQAAGIKRLDDPKLLRLKLKKKEKQKVTSGKKWKQRLAQEQKEKMDAMQKIKQNPRRRMTGKRAGFEGKHGSKFLNSS